MKTTPKPNANNGDGAAAETDPTIFLFGTWPQGESLSAERVALLAHEAARLGRDWAMVNMGGRAVLISSQWSPELEAKRIGLRNAPSLAVRPELIRPALMDRSEAFVA